MLFSSLPTLALLAASALAAPPNSPPSGASPFGPPSRPAAGNANNAPPFGAGNANGAPPFGAAGNTNGAPQYGAAARTSTNGSPSIGPTGRPAISKGPPASGPTTRPSGNPPNNNPGNPNPNNPPAGIPTGGPGGQTGCPAAWFDVSKDLMTSFVDGNGCTDDARAAIRLAFHDCFPGACDGSVILSNECSDRPENAQLVGICGKLGSKAKQFNVGTADMIQFAAAYGIAACPGAPRVSFKAGRTDTNKANPANQLPAPTTNAATLVSVFAAKGFSATELVALVGAHTAAKNIAGQAFDTSVSRWDNRFYGETVNGTAPASLDSDKFLSNTTGTSQIWSTFAKDSRGWSAAFVPAMEKLAVMGNDPTKLVDCSAALFSRSR